MMNLVLGEMSYLLFASQRVSSKKIEEEGFDFNYPNISSALRDIYISNRDQPSGYDVLPKEYLKS
jgi:NAD dependent epimerase/dehydratase family enzyme